jgi:hypothetical protein
MLLGGLVGWLTAHFDTAFDRAAVVQENTKYAWWAERLGRPATAERIRRRRSAGAGDETGSRLRDPAAP